jgi:hypothetical protein
MISNTLYRYSCFSGILLVLAVITIFAYRPFVTDDAATVINGTFEFETGADYWSNNAEFGFGLKHGITARMDIGVSLGHVTLPENERCFHGAEIGLKYALVPEMLAVSVAGCFGDPAYGANLVFSKSITFFSIHTNLGYSAIATTNDAEMTYGFASDAVIKKFSVGGEICGTHKELNWWQVGTIFTFTDWLVLDLGVGGNFEKNIAMNATTGLWFAFPIPKTINKEGE